jgi:glycosyltransferase involved in cell wall biosynthesis
MNIYDLRTPDSDRSNTDQFSLQPLIDLVNIGLHTVHHVLEIAVSDSLVILTAHEQWAYAISFPLKKLGDDFAGRTIFRVSGWVNSGRVGIGLVKNDGSTYVQEVFHTPHDGLNHFDLIADSLADCWAVVVRNATEGGLAARVTIEAIKAYRVLQEPVTVPVAVRWVEHRLSIPSIPQTPIVDDPECDGGKLIVHVAESHGTTNESKPPAVSVILTVKNGMPYLPLAITSLRQQQYRNFELIVQDCLSTDGSLEYLREIDDIQTSIESERDNGIGDAWKRAYRRCRGDIIGSIDSDNLMKPNALSTVVLLLQEYPSTAAVYGGVEMINEDGTTNSCFVPAPFDVLQLISCELVPPWSTSFFSRRACGSHLFFDESLSVCADFDVWLRISHLPILQTSKVLGSTRLSNKSMSCRVESYDLFCDAKIHALECHVNKIVERQLATALLRLGIVGIYCWAAESLQRLGANRSSIEKFIDLALQVDATSSRATFIRGTL